ncbi:MAG: M3 family peptidase [Helicobacteraceae bacterium]|nr:M3 family peptidase [Helicobacteraceae bacterium]
MNFIKFECNMDSFIDDLKAILKTNNIKVEELLKQEEKTYKNFVVPFAMMSEKLDQFFIPLSHINSVNNSEKSQEVYADALPIITEYSTILSQNIDIYNVFKNLNEELNVEQERVVELNILHFELSGAHLDEKSKKRLQEINLRKSVIANDFSQNLLNATNAYEKIITNEEDIKGIPESDLNSFEEDGVTKYKFTLQMPSYIAYMTYGPNSEIREEIYKAYTTRAPQNAELIDELLYLRSEMSKILGFKNYAEYSLASKMAPTTESVEKFLNELCENSIAQAKVEIEELKSTSNVAELKSYDTAFYSEILKKAKYDIDEEEYRPYFEQKSVVNGMFEFLNRLFGLEFKKVNEQLWDEKATSYDLYLNGKLRSRLYMDLEARESKRGGAWMHNFQSHCEDEESNEKLASAFVVCNFPSSTPESPSLLRHDDVVTLFHEMGHALHHMLSTVNEVEVSGVNGVEWDAVEFPSQFLENFAYEPKVLKLFATHYKNGDVISDEMIEKLIKSKNFLSASGMLRQLEFSLFDFIIHSKDMVNVQEELDAIRANTALIKPPSYNKFQNGFAHIFAGGYAAGYYSYKWAEVLSADAYFAIVDQGIFDTKVGTDYLNIVLSRGGSQSMDELFKELLGREADTSALLRLNGIA